MHRFFLPIIYLVMIILAGCTAGLSPQQKEFNTSPEAALNKTWQWESTTTPVKTIISKSPENYTVLLGTDGRASLQIDCNRGMGTFEISQGKLSFSPLASTRMACPPGSMDWLFIKDLQRVVSFFTRDDCLYLELPYDSGTMKFRRE